MITANDIMARYEEKIKEKKINNCYDDGLSIIAIAKYFMISKSTVDRIIKDKL